MKKITLFTMLFVFVISNVLKAAEINVDLSMDLKTAIMGAATGDVIVLTESGTYKMAYITANPSLDLTIKAASGLATKPIVQFNSATDAIPFTVPDGMKLTLDGIVFDGYNSISFFVMAQYTNMATIKINNCDFIGMTNAAGTGGSIVVGKKGATSNWTAPIGNVEVTNCTFEGVPNYIFLSTSASFKSVVFRNCLIKGAATLEAFANTTTKPDTYVLDHITFTGRNFRELSITSNVSIDYSNLIFANNNYVAKGLQPGTITSQNKLAFYNYSPTRNLFLATVDNIDPLFDAKGIATATQYVNAGTDGKTIGYYGPTVTALKEIHASQLSIFPTTLAKNGTITVSNKLEDANFDVLNATGAMVSNGKLTNGQIKLNNFTNGIYFVKVNNAVAKFIVR